MPKAEIFFWAIIGFFIGIFFASFNLNFVLIICFIASILFFVFSFKFKKIPIYFLGFFSLMIICGASYFYFYSYRSFSKCKFHSFLGKKIFFIGKVIEIPNKKEFYQLVKVFSKDPQGKILLKASNSYQIDYGDLIKVEGEIKKAPKYLDKENIFYEINYPKIKIISKNKGNFIKSFLFKISLKIQENLSFLFPIDEANFAQGIILGKTPSLSKEFSKKLSFAGLSHIIALSGFNISIISHYLFNFLIFFFRRDICFWITLFLIALFVLMTGGLPSCVRAAIMASVYLLSLKGGRQYHPKYALFFACFLMVLFNPKILCFDLGFQFSFLATLGLIYFTLPLKNFYLNLKLKIKNHFLEKIFNSEKFNSFLDGFFFPALAAQISIFGLVIKSFSQFPLVGIFSNLFILPLIPISMLVSFLSGILGFFSESLAILFSFAVFPLFKFQIVLIDFFSKFPLLKFPREFSLIIFIFWYILIWKWVMGSEKWEIEK